MLKRRLLACIRCQLHANVPPNQEAGNIVIIIHARSKLSRRSPASVASSCRIVPFISHDVGHANKTFVTVRRASTWITSADVRGD